MLKYHGFDEQVIISYSDADVKQSSQSHIFLDSSQSLVTESLLETNLILAEAAFAKQY